MKKFSRVLSIVLLISLLSQTLPSNVVAIDATEIADVSNYAEALAPLSEDIVYSQPEKSISTIVGEEEELREINVKHFRRNDGSFLAAVYNTPVHYKSDAGWQDIDNTLELSLNNEGTRVYKNKASNAKVSIPEKLTKDSVLSLGDGKHEIEFSVIGVETEIPAKVNNPTSQDFEKSVSRTTDNISEGSPEKTGLAKLSSKVKYCNAFRSTDLEYQVIPTGIKESIIINEQRSAYQFSFLLGTSGLIAEINADNSISIYDGIRENEVFVIEAPFMFDALNETSRDIQVKLTPQKDSYILTITANEEWINSAERAWPIIIDPTLTLKFNDNQIHDTYVDTSQPNYSFYQDYYTYVGNNSLGRTRTYIKFDLPKIPDCSIVIDANLHMLQYEYDPGSGSMAGAADNINVYEVETSGWNFDNITWNNQPFSTSASAVSGKPIVDYCSYGNNTTEYKWYYWNITSIVKNWYEDGINKGLALISADETASEKSRFFSPSHYWEDERTWPGVSLAYVNNNGLEDYWTYETFNLGRSGTVFINDYNGNFVYNHTDFSMNGNRMPINLSHVYTLDSQVFDGAYGDMKLGIGFRFNVLEQIATSTISGYPYKLIDSDGTVHYFKSTSTTNQYTHEFNSKTVLIKTVANGNVTGYTLTDDGGNVKTFTAGGYLKQLKDSNLNTQNINYTGNRITSITDGAGRSITLNYNSNNCLSSVVDHAGRSTTYTYTLVGANDYYLSRITYPDGEYTNFNYNGGRIQKITAIDSTCLEVLYKTLSNPNGNIYRVSEVTKKGSSGTIANKLTFTYRDGETVVSDNFGKSNYIMFDTAGRTVCVRDQASRAGYSTYNNTGNKTNTVKSTSTMQSAVQNLVKNHSAEISDSTWYKYTSAGGTGNTTIASNEHYLGNKSLKVESTSVTGRVGYCQAFTGNPGATYTFSGYMKIPTAISSSTGGAFVGLTYENNGTWYIKRGEFVTSQSAWGRYVVTLTIPTTSTGSMGLVFCIENTSGIAYFDCAQLEKSWVVNQYNLLENDSFDRVSGTTPVGWTPQSCSSSTDMAVANWSGNGFKIAGVPGADKRIMQTIQVNGNVGDTIVFGAWGKADASGQCNDADSGRTFKLCLSVIYTDNTVTYTSIDFNHNVVNWQYVCGAITVAKACKSINYYLTYYDEVNSVIFDHAQLYIDNFGSSYQYNDDGKIIKSISGIGEEINYTYDGPDITSIQTVKNAVEQEKVTYTYDNKHNLLTATTKRGVKTIYSYNTDFDGNTVDSKGCQTKIKVQNSDMSLKSEVVFGYTTDFNYLNRVKDARGKTTTYNYNSSKGLQNWVEDDDGNRTTYTYDSDNDQLLSTSGQADINDVNSTVTNGYAYSNDRLDTITHNGFSYGFTYDQYGRVTASKVGTQTLVSNLYNSNGTLSKSTYGNGDYYEPVYDSLDRVIGDDYNGARKYTYAYNKNGEIGRETDVENNKSWDYEYDLAGRIAHTHGSDGTQLFYTYDEKGNTKTVLAKQNSTTLSNAEYIYGTDNLLTQVKLKSMHNGSINYTYDSINRLANTVHTPMSGAPAVTFKTSNAYLMVGDNRTGLIAQKIYAKIDSTSGTAVTTQHGKLNYTYDSLGNIKTIKENDVLKATYTYDGLNQLIREDNVWLNKSVTYTYDQGGNILAKSEYAYTTGTLGTVQSTVNYTYADTNWKDKLTAYNGQTITYDQIGNPLSYRGYTLNWQGRRLYSLSGNGVTASYKYNSSGLRSQKVSNGTTTDYTYAGGALISQTDGTDTLNYLYSPDGQMIGVSRNGYNYYYMRNAQGDIIALYNCYGNINSRYVYDSWGKLLSVTNASGTPITDQTQIAHVNPIRYRGYYYDKETGLYSLQSRYYDPEIGRFINADNQLSTGSDLTGMNLFAYCGNNPIMRVDPTGHAWWHWAIAAAVVVVAAAAVVVTAGGAAPALLAVASVANGVAAATTASTVAAGVFIGSATAFGGAALVAASNSKSVSDFNEQGNWGTVAGTVGGGLIGGVDGYSMAKSQNSSPSKSVPNPNGKKGGAAHQAEIAKQTAKFDPSQVRYEVKINTPGGAKPYRYADFSVTQNGQTWYGNVGRGLQSGLPCARERAAISDIQGAGGTIYFFPYN